MNFYNLPKKLLKTSALLVLGNPFLLKMKINLIKKRNCLTVLNLHRVGVADGSSYIPFDPLLFEELLIFLKSNFELIIFDKLADVKKPKKPKLILSFDDGYKDFIYYAVPILKKHKIQANLNIIPSCVESQLPPLNVMAQDFIGKAPLELIKKLSIPGFNLKPYLPFGRIIVGLHLSNFIKNRSMNKQEAIRKVLIPQFFKFEEFHPTKMMSLDEIKQISKYHEIGAHSYSHASMEYEDDEYLSDDLLKCYEYFNNSVNTSVHIYAFPNGSVRENQARLALEFGYKHVLLVGNLFSNLTNNIHTRFGFYANSKKEAFFRATGGLTKPSLN